MDGELVELACGDAHGACLLGHDALGALAGDGVDFEEEELLSLGVVDVVETDDAAAVEEVVELGGDFLDVLADGFFHLGRGYFVAEAVVFGGIVEELVAAGGDNLGDGEDEFLLLSAEDAAVELAALDELFDEDLFVLGEGFGYSGHELFGGVDLGGGHAAAACCGLDEEGQVQL